MTESQPPLDSQPPLHGEGAPAKKAEGLAAAALILGIYAWIPFLGLLCGPAALILGIVALAKKTSRKDMAGAGIAICLIGLFVNWVAYGISRDRTVCRNNLYVIVHATHEYAREKGGQFPLPPDLQTLIDEKRILEEVLKCPSAYRTRACDYFYLAPEGGAVEAPSMTIVICDLKDNHSRKGRNICYVDGSVMWRSEAEFQRQLNLPPNAKFAAALRAVE